MLVIQVPGAMFFSSDAVRAYISRIHYVEAEEKMLALDPGTDRKAYVAGQCSHGFWAMYVPALGRAAITRSHGRIQDPRASFSLTPSILTL